MWQHASECNRRPNQCIKLLISANRKLQVARCDAFDLQVLCRVAGKFQNFGGKVFEHGGEVDGGLGADSSLLSRYQAEVTLYAAAGELRCGVQVSKDV